MTEARAMLDRVRQEIVLDQYGSFRPVLERDPYYECNSCECATVWTEADRAWRCPSCGNELTLAEARKLLASVRLYYRTLLDQVDARRGKGWLWRKIFSR